MADFAFVQELTGSAAGSTPIDLTVPAGGIPAGDLIVILSRLNAVGQERAPAASDSRGNTYSRVQTTTNGEQLHILYCLVVTPLHAGDLITVTQDLWNSSGLTAAASVAALQFTGITTGVPVADQASINQIKSSLDTQPFTVTSASTNPVSANGTSRPSSAVMVGAIGLGRFCAASLGPPAYGTVTLANSAWTNLGAIHSPNSASGQFASDLIPFYHYYADAGSEAAVASVTFTGGDLFDALEVSAAYVCFVANAPGSSEPPPDPGSGGSGSDTGEGTTDTGGGYATSSTGDCDETAGASASTGGEGATDTAVGFSTSATGEG